MARKNLFRDIAGVFSSNVFALINALVVSIILTKTLGPEGFGIYASITVIPLVVISLTQLGIQVSSVYYIGKDEDKMQQTISAIMMILLLTALAGMILAFVSFFFIDTGEYSLFMKIIVIVFIPMHLISLYAGGIFLGKEYIRKANFIRWFPVFANLLFVLLFVLAFRWEVEGALLSILLAYILVAVWSLITLSNENSIKPCFHRSTIVKLLKMGGVFALSVFVIQLNYRIDILILKSLTEAKQVGYYSLGASIGEVLWQLPLAVGVVVISRSANIKDQSLMNETTAKLLRLTILISFIGAVVIFLLAPWVIPFIWGENFIPTIDLLRFILPGILFLTVYRIIHNRLSGMGKPQIAIYVFLPALCINIILNYWLIPVYGAIGAVISTNASYILGSIGFVLAYSRIVRMPLNHIFNYRKNDFNFLKEIFIKGSNEK